MELKINMLNIKKLKHLILLLLLLVSFVSFSQKKVRVINNKGTVIYVDPSKWFQVSGNLYNKNGTGNVAIGLDTLTTPTARLVISNGGSTTIPALKLDSPFAGVDNDDILTWNSVDGTVRKRTLEAVVSEPWFSTATNKGAISNTDNVYIMGRAMVGAKAPATVASAGSNPTAYFTVTGGDASINGLTVGKGGGQAARNVALGFQGLYNNTTGDYNNAIGYRVLENNISGNYNSGIGSGSLLANTTGSSNMAVGASALSSNTTGGNNIGIGASSLRYNIVGKNNTAIGSNSLNSSIGNNNIAIGYNAAFYQSAGDNNIVIGSLLVGGLDLPDVTGSNQLNIGNVIFGNSINSSSVGVGNIGIGTNSPATKLEIKNGSIPNSSGLRLTNLTSSSPVTAGATAIGVNANGDVVTTDAAATAWKLNGNAGTTPGTNFIGTTDDKDFVFKRNNFLAGTIAVANTSFGVSALNTTSTGTFNTAIGVSTLTANTTGAGNTATGNSALTANTTGNYNAASGSDALHFNTTGYNNTANGYQALQSNTIGYNNTAIGSQVLVNNQTGNYNTGIGTSALFMNTANNANTATGYQALYTNTADGMTATGYRALYSNTTGINSTATGYQALYSNTTGNSNTANGNYALYSNTTGRYNTAIGDNALYVNTTADFNTAVGYQALQSMKFNEAPFGLEEELIQILKALKCLVEGSGNSFELKMNVAQDIVVNSDAIKIHELFYNIIGNANKFTNEGNIVVSVECSEDGMDRYNLGVKIQDNGVGISKEDLKNIFEAYFEGEVSSKVQNLGVGLGLNLCRELIELFQGSINVESELNIGTLVSFNIFLKKFDNN